MDLRDRLVRGFIAGLVAGIAMNIFNLSSYYLGIAELRYLDWGAVVIYGLRPENVIEAVFAQIAQLLFVSNLGIIFAYLILFIGSVSLLFKGWLYGGLTWFLLYGITLLYKVEATIPLHFDTAASDFIGASIFGLVLAWVLGWLDDRVEQNN